MTHLLIVGGDEFTFETMRFALSHTAGATLFGVVQSDGDIAAAIEEARADIVVVDGVGDLPGAARALRDTRAAAPDAVILVVVRERDEALNAAAAEHRAVVCVWPAAAAPKPAEGVVHLSPAAPVPEDDIARDRPPHSPLTTRELETLRWVAEGHTNAWIARKLWVTEQTVKFHLSNIYRKLGVANRTEASHYALVHDLFEADEAPRAPHRELGAVAQSAHR